MNNIDDGGGYRSAVTLGEIQAGLQITRDKTRSKRLKLNFGSPGVAVYAVRLPVRRAPLAP